ncbi:hypothetical protein [Pseudomonas syringae pv. coryli]|uniref:hypothetical protein n=1 Tax=Pseudomonas syringae pv. coryli TaxID=317659 RepID=UPI003D265DFC
MKSQQSILLLSMIAILTTTVLSSVNTQIPDSRFLQNSLNSAAFATPPSVRIFQDEYGVTWYERCADGFCTIASNAAGTELSTINQHSSAGGMPTVDVAALRALEAAVHTNTPDLH